MIPMMFYHFCGEDVCTTAEDVKVVLQKEIHGVNEFRMTSSVESAYPYLSILVNRDFAYLFYMPQEDSDIAGFQAYEEENELDLDPDGVTLFSVNTPTEELEVSNESVCSKEKATQVVLAFMEQSQWPSCIEELPNCVQWEEL